MTHSRILIVENENRVVENIQHSLVSLGYTVPAIASSGPQALELVAETHPDLVLMQMRLNESMEGVEAAAYIRTHFDLPVVYLTAYTGDAIWQQAQPSEPFGYVLKPFAPRELQLVIEATLQQQAAGKITERKQRFQPDISSTNLMDGIVERRQTDEALRKSEATYRALLNSIPDLIIRLSRDGTYLDIKLAKDFESLAPRDELLGKKIFEVLPEELAERRMQAVEQVLQTGQAQIFEQKVLRDNEICDEEVRVVASGADEVLVIVRDITRRKQAQEALREREERFRVVADTAPVLIWMSGPDALCTFFNKPWLDFTGRTMEQELGNGWSEGVHPDDYERCLDIYLSAVNKRQDFTMEYRLRRADGEYRWIIDNAIPRFEGDTFVGHIGSCMDITERKQTEEALRIRDRAMAATRNGITIADVNQPDLPLIYCNPAFEKITGYTKAEVLGRNCRFLQGPDTDPAALKQIRQALRRGSECQVELKNYRKDGTPFWNELIISPIRDEAGRLTHFVGIQNDITPRKQAEERLRASEERFRQVISSISHHIYVTKVTPEGYRYNLYLSPHVETLTGYSMEKFMADWSFWPSTMIHPDDRAAAAAQANQLAHGQNGEAEYRIIRADGQIIWVRDSGRAEREGNSTIIYGVVSDITKRKYLEEQLRQSQKMEAVGRLAGGVAHDFNNLLTIIISDCNSILNSRFARNTSLRDHVEEIKEAAEQANALIRQLLAFSRKQILEPKVLDLNIIVTEVSKLLGRLIGEHIELVNSLDSQLKPVKADLHQLEQVIVNLAVNARDAMLKGGQLTIATINETLDESSTSQWLIEPGNYVKLTIRDTGVGMDAETQARIFEPFFTTKKPGEGTGLGLATVYGIIQQSGGHITVTSAPGQGTTFTIYLPQVETVSETIVSQAIPPAKLSMDGSETIMLVEDETRVRAIIRKFLQKAGYTVLEARSSEEALSFCQEYEGPIHLLVTDIMMPGLSGPELAERLTAVRPAIKVLYMSGYADEVITQQILTPDVVLLQKPFAPEALARKAWEVLHSPASENIGST